MIKPYNPVSTANMINQRGPTTRTMSGCGDSESYALRVIGDSMEPEFRDGEIIIVEPTTRTVDGTFVIAQHRGEPIFRQLTKQGEIWLLTPLNRRYPSLETNGDSIEGRVIAKSSGRGRQQKQYL